VGRSVRGHHDIGRPVQNGKGQSAGRRSREARHISKLFAVVGHTETAQRPDIGGSVADGEGTNEQETRARGGAPAYA